jgi:peptide/nickel transport system substrate-binding protein
MAEIRCPKCNAINRSTARFCSECGTPLTAQISQEPAPAQPNQPDSASDASRVASSAAQKDAADQPSSALPVLETGKVLLGRYRLAEELGRGGFGAVYKGWDANLNRPCAIKENLDTSPEAQRQFQREASVLANLSHPNLPRVTDHFTIPGQGQYLVMDFVEGQDLAERVQELKTIPLEQALPWIIQVADALTYLHSRQPAVLHRDIKPANIRITPEGRAMLVDFGLVKMYDPALKTTMGARAVTPGYAPPEQYGQGRTDARSDIYALGATLYKILTGRDPLESVLRISGERMPLANQLNPRIPPQLSQIIDKALALDPANRFQSAAEFKAALEIILAPLSTPALVTRGMSPAQAAARVARDREMGRSAEGRAERRSPWIWIALGGAALLLVLCLAAGGGILALLGINGGVTPTARAALTTIEVVQTPTAENPTSAPTLPPTPNPAFLSKDPTVYVHVDEGEPDTLDPAKDYEVSGLQVIQNIYDTLIFYRKEDPNAFIPQLAIEVPSVENGGISEDGLIYTFRIRPNVRFHDGSLLTAEDVAYTFQRNILQGGSNSPMWLLTEPIFGIGVYDIAALVDPAYVDDPARLAKANPEKLQAVCQRLKEAIQADNNAGLVTFRLAQSWAPFLPTIANGWGGVRSKAWTIANGGWDGDCRTWQNYYGRTIEQLNKTPLGAAGMGTGPYRFDHWTPGEEIVLRANEDYWRKEPAWEGGPFGAPAIKTVIIRYRSNFADRLSLLQAGEADTISAISSTDWPALDRLAGQICRVTDADCQPTANPGGRVEMLRGFPTASRNWDVFMNWQINAQGGNDLIGSGRLDGNGVPPDFFSNVHIRRAFQYCFNYDAYLNDVLLGEGVRSINVMLPGMIGYDANSPYYTYDPYRCEDEFRQAIFNGRNVWDTGFALKLPYVQGSTPRQKIVEIMKNELTAINSKFKVEVVELESNDYWSRYAEDRLPIFHGAWIEDIHDPHNWVVPFTVGNYAVQMNMPADLTNQFQQLINRAVEETDPERRAAIYREYNRLYYETAPAILLFQTMGRQYQQRWVRGWYNNPVFPGLYFYVLSKD